MVRRKPGRGILSIQLASPLPFELILEGANPPLNGITLLAGHVVLHMSCATLLMEPLLSLE
jgi:hypothetical protein